MSEQGGCIHLIHPTRMGVKLRMIVFLSLRKIYAVKYYNLCIYFPQRKLVSYIGKLLKYIGRGGCGYSVLNIKGE